MQSSGGSGLLGTGLAAAGGFAAVMLAEKMLEGDHGREVVREVDRGGLQPGMFDDAPNAAAQGLESRSIDFGSGGDWGADGSADFGGGERHIGPKQVGLRYLIQELNAGVPFDPLRR